MTALAPHLTTFLREHLPHERKASPNTCAAYAYSFQLLLCFAAARLKVKPSLLEIEQFDAPLILTFLKHIESERRNSPRTRNARLAAVNSFFRFLEYRLPSSLTREEMQALLNAPDPRTTSGTRDRAMLYLAFAAGLRVSELTSLRLDQLDDQDCSSIHVIGKGRRERVLPLWKETAKALKAWLAVRRRDGDPELFLNAVGRAMTRSGFAYILAKHVAVATAEQPSITKKRVTPHVLRRTCAMHTLRATRDVRKVSLWLGHASLQSTEIYLRADPTEKLEALSAIAPLTLPRGRFSAPDKLIAMLNDVRRSNNYAD
jgi:integrase/recombinase XerD